MLGRGPSRGGCKLSLQRFDSETETLPAFEPPRQQPPAAACPSLSKEGTKVLPLAKRVRGRSRGGGWRFFTFGGAAPRHARLT